MLTSPIVRLPSLRTLGTLLACVAPLLLSGLALQRPGPLLLNLGAGDEGFARGFRGSWERDGLTGSGETMFRWTQDGSRLEWPVRVTRGNPTFRLRLARFLDSPVDVTLMAGDRRVDSWIQSPRGWTLREVTAGLVEGPVRLEFRSESPDPDHLGLALDWVELRGAERVVPTAEVLWRAVLLLAGIPALFFMTGRAREGLAVGGLLTLAGPTAIALDRMGGLLALAGAALPTLAITAGLLLAAAVARSRGGTAPILIPALFAMVALIALSHPFYYYPDVDTHARFMAALRANPSLLLDPSPFQIRFGAWTREIAGRRVAFPYSPVFHLAAWPIAGLLGDVPAIKTLAVASASASLMLVRALALEAGLDPRAAALASGLLATMPVLASRLTLALYPALLGQALELGLLLHLARRWPRVRRFSDVLPTFLFMAAALAAYTGSLINVSLIVLALAGLLAAHRAPGNAARLLVLHAGALALVILVLYSRFVPVLLTEVLPQARPAAAALALDGSPWQRLLLFFGVVYPALMAGFLALRSGPARRVIAAALLAGLSLLVLRYAIPTVFRDAKDIELLAAPLALTAAAAAGWLMLRGRMAGALAILLALSAMSWGVLIGAGLYADRFFALGR